MNIRSLTRGDGAVIGAAALLLIASFLPYISIDSQYGSGSKNLWHSDFFPTMPSVTLTAVAAAGAVFASRAPQFNGKQVLGLSFKQWSVALALFSGWTAVWAVLFTDFGPYDKGAGAWLSLVFGLVIAVVAPLSDRLPALKAPLASAPAPAGQQPYAVGGPSYGATPQQAGYGYPGGAQSVDPNFGQQPYGAQTAAPQAPQPTAAASDFSAFWFAVPVPRPLYAEDGSGAQIAELTPGTWYLAVDQRGAQLIAQTQDGRRGVLQDSSGIQRG
ncbi:hypothetical protein [Streptomyces sp. NRRL F-5123]|uniref:hypothetical protein n=1 Tax=Streptomyces sp. NRRL F-5123 TaxID=1463856 RepID=UPI0004E2601D|nr:hypothetical protein [Streptomyces sp. NRRL F-5123]